MRRRRPGSTAAGSAAAGDAMAGSVLPLELGFDFSFFSFFIFIFTCGRCNPYAKIAIFSDARFHHPHVKIAIFVVVLVQTGWKKNRFCDSDLNSNPIYKLCFGSDTVIVCTNIGCLKMTCI